MKNKIFLVLSIALVIALGYLVTTGGKKQPAESVKTEREALPATASSVDAGEKTPQILTYVPADTLFFSGGLQAAPFASMLRGAASTQDIDDVTQAIHAAFEQETPGKKGETQTTMAKPKSEIMQLFFGLAMEYLKVEHDEALAAKTLGMASEVESAVYSVGTTPIFRVKINNEQAFESYLDSAEKTGKVTSAKEVINGVNFRTYGLGLDRIDDSQLWQTYKAYITVHQGYALIFVATDEQLSAQFASILGDEKPSMSLADVDVLQTLAQQYQFDPRVLAYTNDQEIFKALTDETTAVDPMLYLYASTTTQGWLLELLMMSDMMGGEAIEFEGYTRQFLTELKGVGCQKDFVDFLQYMPRTVMGYKKLKFEQMPMDMEFVTLTETTPPLLDSLQGLRGFVPRVLRGADQGIMFGLGLGVNAGVTLSELTKGIQYLTDAQYTCELLVKQQAVVRESTGPAMMGMAAFSGMVSGIKGLSMVVFDTQVALNSETQQVDVKSLDGAVVLSADSPATLLLMAGGFVEEFNLADIPLDGTEKPLSLPIPWPEVGQPSVAVKGNHIVIFIGDKARAFVNELATEEFGQVGMVAMSLDLRLLADRFLPVIEAKLENQPSEKIDADAMKRVFAFIRKLDVKLNYLYDTNDAGMSSSAELRYQVTD